MTQKKRRLAILLSILIMSLMIATPFMSFATEGDLLGVPGNDSAVTGNGSEDNTTDSTEEATDNIPGDETGNTAQDTNSSETGAVKVEENIEASSTEKTSDNLSTEPTEVTVAGSVEELSDASDAAYDNDAFFTIDAAKDDSAELATDEVSDIVTDILSGSGSASKKQNALIDTLEDSGFYRAEESGKTEVEVTSKFAYQRLRLVADKEKEINAYGATKAVYFNGSYLLSYDSMEATMLAYDALLSEYGNDAVLIDMPMKLNGNEKGWGTSYMRMSYHKTLPENKGPVTVAVIDSGIMRTHPVFSGRTILDGKDFVNNDNDPTDDNGHGTAVAGVIAESTPSGVKILPLKAMDARGEGSLIDVINATEYAEEKGADIINLSIGGYLDNVSDMEEGERLFSNCNALIVCAAGNENKNMDAEGVNEFPGELHSTVCVGSITADKEHSSFSNYGSAVDFATPGSRVLLASLDGSYAYESGTSFSAPYLAAAAALVKAGHAEYSNKQITDYLESISEDMGDTGKDVYFGNGCPRFSQDPDHQHDGDTSGDGVTTTVTGEQKNNSDTGYQLSAGGIASQTKNTAVFKWKMNRDLTDGAKVTINGRVVNPTKNSEGIYTFNVTGFDPGRTYVIPVKVVKNGKAVSNELRIGVYPYYCIGEGKVTSATSSTAVINWKSHRPLEAGDKVSINGRVVNPTKNSDGSYSFNVSGFDPAHGNYSIPVKFVDKNGRAMSNVINITVNTGYQLSAGGVKSQTRNTAVFTWKMNRAPDAGAKVTINGRVVNPTKNSDGTYTCNVTGFDPGKTYVIPVKVVNKNGKTASNELRIGVYPYYCIGQEKVTDQTPTTAVFNWRSHRPLEAGDKVSINGRAVNPTKNGDGSYSFTVTGFDPARSYSIPVKFIDKNGRAVSNVIYVAVGKYTSIPVKSISISGPQYLAAGRAYKLQATVNKNATNKSLGWNADNTSVATVDNSGRVTAIGNGTATIYVKALDGSGTKASYKINSHKYTRDETEWIAHRGLHTKELENTAAAFTAAGEAGGFWGCECDIFETKHDGEDSFDIVINHDASYKRVFGVDKKVNEVTADEIRNSTGPLRNVCFLKDYLTICKRYNMVPVIEFKGDLGFTDAGIEKAIKMVDEEGLLDDAYFVSFDAGLLDRVQTHIENTYGAQPYFGYLIEDDSVMAGIDLAKQKGFSGINLAYPKLTPEIDKKCIDNELELGTWTYGSDASIKYMYEHIISGNYHVVSATTDYPFFN